MFEANQKDSEKNIISRTQSIRKYMININQDNYYQNESNTEEINNIPLFLSPIERSFSIN